MQISSKAQVSAKRAVPRFADIASSGMAIGFVIAVGLVGLFAALPLLVGDFFLILPGFWP